MTIYELQNVEKRLGAFSLKVNRCCLEKGNIYAIVGPNGGGKTTFLHTLGFLSPPCKGEVYFNQDKLDYTDPKVLAAARMKVGYLLQNPYLFNMTVYDNVCYGLKIRGLAKNLIGEKVHNILSRLELSHLANRKTHRLSRGESQRVALARTLVIDADIFLLDEPTANVDKDSIRRLEEMIVSLNKQKNATVILATHLAEQAYRLSNKIIPLVGGEIKDIIYENVFRGIVNQASNGVRSMYLNKDVQLTLSKGEKGPAAVAIDPQDIILSRSKLQSSALNNFYGKINKIEELNGSLRVFVDTGITFCALVTGKSFYDMELNIGKKVWMTFKANSIKII